MEKFFKREEIRHAKDISRVVVLVLYFCIWVADKRRRSCSKNLLHVPQSSTKFGDCSFSIAGPSAWNSLPDHVKNASLLETFKSKLKTHIFKQSLMASKCLNPYTAPFLSALAVLRAYGAK